MNRPRPRGARLVALSLAAAALGAAAAAQQPAREALLLEISGPIGPATALYVEAGLADAAGRDAGLVVLRLDTPGGLDLAMRDIVRSILASPVPVASWVAPAGARAASAGTYILYGSHVAAMAPGTNLGAATPVQLGGEGPALPGPDESEAESEGERPRSRAAMEAKTINDSVAYIRGLAELHGRNADWAERAVREAASLTASAALEEGVVDLLAADIDALLSGIDGRTVILRGAEATLETAGLAVVPLAPDWRARLLAVITNPNVAYILMMIGIYGIIFELANPGTIFPGVIGGISLLIGLFALNLLPISYAGAGLLLLGVALMVAEAFAPSFGILGIGGAAAFAIGSVMLFDAGTPYFALSWPVILLATATSAGLLSLVLAAAVRAHRRRVASGAEALLGLRGRVIAWSGSGGKVLVRGERWRARARRPLARGQPVVVRDREDLTLIVEPEDAA